MVKKQVDTMAEAEKALNASLSNVRIEIKDDSYTEFSGGLSTASIVKRYFNGENAWNMTSTTGSSYTFDDRCHNVCICITGERSTRTTPYPS